ncbi:LOW QUALITY PROTEIN: neuroligin-4, X-linked-like [Palaemon carinicauda]|uniref:LOW QUALITY PROTEIN: neuroligin-4, X-linked-like n=1 Tax=Palaemon carinicauda TaxID=392227 RepID=UPI0035B6770D
MNLGNVAPGKQINVFSLTVLINFSILSDLTSCESPPKTPAISTKYGQLRGFYRQVTDEKLQVATYLGIPYATPPIGANRFSPTRALSQWVGVHEATHFGPSCPQRFPDLSNETEALTRMTKDRYDRLRKYQPALKRQSEDCLYLNIYVPHQDAALMAYPVVVFIQGESFEWGSSSLYDGSVLAALGKVIVVTLNYRLGILGFYNANPDPEGHATVANYGLMDQLAALHWVQENIVRFGGDPGQVTVMGHGTGAACLNYLVISPAATGAGLFKRAILMSGSALSPWASIRDPSGHDFDVATQLGCPVPNDLFRHYENLLQCLRKRPLHDILQVQLKTSKFQVAVGPSIDGVTIKPDWEDHMRKMGKEGRTPVDLLLGMTSANLLDILSQQEVKDGFDAKYREDLLRSFVVNNYRYHLQEIMLAITAEYTDWSRSLHQPISIRDSTGQGLHDANIVSPMADLAKQLYTTSRSSYLYVLEEEVSDSGNESLLLNELAYVFGGPVGALGPLASSYNFTKMDVTLSKSFISMWSNFIALLLSLVALDDCGGSSSRGFSFMKLHLHPRDTVSKAKMSESANDITSEEQIWPKYDPVYQRYFQIGTQNSVRDHYHAGKVALWSWLLPGLERVGTRYGPDKNFHRLPTDLQSGLYPESTGQYNFTEGSLSSPITPTLTGLTNTPHNLTIVATANKNKVSESGNLDMLSQMGKDFPYTTALSVTVAITCSLLILNILVLTTVYYRHKANRRSLAKGLQDANSESGNDVQLHSSGDNCKTIYAPGHYGTLRPSITMHSSLATAFEEESQHDWPPDYISSVQNIDDITGVTSNRLSPDTQGIVSNTQTLHEPKENIITVTTLKQPVASYTSPNDGQLVSTYSPVDGQLVPTYSPKDGQQIPNYLSSSAFITKIRE